MWVVADCERLLGTDHPDTVAMRENLSLIVAIARNVQDETTR